MHAPYKKSARFIEEIYMKNCYIRQEGNKSSMNLVVKDGIKFIYISNSYLPLAINLEKDESG